MDDIFIVGVGRSGTSLLQSMLHAHSKITSTPESHFVRNYLVSKKRLHFLEQKGPIYFKGLLINDPHFQRLAINVEEIKSLTIPPLSILQVYKEITTYWKKKNKKKVLIDKDPRNLENLMAIRELLPNSKIIHIIRDPRDVVFSKTKANWSSSRPYWLHAMIGEAQMKRGLSIANTLSSKIYHQIKYEDLIEEPNIALKNLCDFIDLSFESKMLHFNEAAKELVTEEEMQWKKETLQPLNKSNTFKWKDSYSNFQLALIEGITVRSMQEFGYSPMAKEEHIHIGQRLVLSVFQLTSKLFTLSYKYLK